MRTTDWMGDILLARTSSCPCDNTNHPIISGPIRLTDLCIPGTHHSGSYSITSPAWLPILGRKIGCTQDISIYKQLLHGARYLDLRVAPTRITNPSVTTTSDDNDDDDDTTFSIWHNFLRGGRIEGILDQVRDFLQDHIHEIVIIELVPEFGRPFTDRQKEQCLVCCCSILDGLLLRCHDDHPSQQKGGGSLLPNSEPIVLQKSVRQILSEGPERVVLVLHHRFDAVLGHSALRPYYGRFLQGSRYFNNPWHNTNDRQQLQEKNLHFIRQECHRRRSGQPHCPYLLCNQLVATPQVETIWQILTLIGTCTRSLWPRTMAQSLYDRPHHSTRRNNQDNNDDDDNDDDSFLTWFRRTLTTTTDRWKGTTYDEKIKWNICSLDFIELCPQLIEVMILANSNTAGSRSTG